MTLEELTDKPEECLEATIREHVECPADWASRVGEWASVLQEKGGPVNDAIASKYRKVARLLWAEADRRIS